MGKSAPTIVLKDRDAKALAAHVVPCKGGDLDCAVQQAGRDFIKWGIRGDVILKCDQEDALKDFVNDLTKLRNAIIEHSPVRESQSNGFIEAGVKTVEGMVRTMKLNLEQRLHECIEVDHPNFCRLVEHADMSTKFQKGVDGKTAYGRLKGKPYRGEIWSSDVRYTTVFIGKEVFSQLAGTLEYGSASVLRLMSISCPCQMERGSVLEQCKRFKSNSCGQRRLLNALGTNWYFDTKTHTGCFSG